MRLLLVPSFSLAFLCLFFTDVHAQYTCSEVFTQHSTLRVAKPDEPEGNTQAQASRSRRVVEDNAQISRNIQLIRDLIQNKKYHSLTYIDRDRKKTVWFLSLSNNGRLYRVVMKLDGSGKVIDSWADKPTEKIEKLYYSRMGELLNIESFSGTIKLPRKGRRELIIDPAALVKLDVKHNIRGEDLIQALRRVPPNVKYHPNNSPHFQGRDSFIFFLDLGQRNPLEVVMLNDGDSYVLVTAFFPRVYIHR